MEDQLKIPSPSFDFLTQKRLSLVTSRQNKSREPRQTSLQYPGHFVTCRSWVVSNRSGLWIRYTSLQYPGGHQICDVQQKIYFFGALNENEVWSRASPVLLHVALLW